MKKITLLALLWMFCTNAFTQNNQTITYNAQDDDIFYHTVERGQTVYTIARMYEVKVEDIYRLNIGSYEMIKAGEVLKIPQKKVSPKQETTSAINDEFIFHTIQAKETPYGVSKKYNVEIAHIIDANPGLSPSTFNTGRTIRIPTGIKKKQISEIVDGRSGEKEVYYTIPEGETVFNICRTFKTNERELHRLNPELAGGLRIGMILRIPLRINEDELPKEAEPSANEVNAMLKIKKEVKLVNATKVAVLLPFDENNPGSADLRIVEYLEGLVLAIDTLRKQNHTIELFVYDLVEDNPQITRKILQEKANILKDVHLIIGGDSNEQIKLIGDFAKANKIKYIVPFKRNDDVYDNPYIFQVNTPQAYLYSNAAYAGANLFGKHNIIILDTKDADEQTDFIKEFKQELKFRNISYKDAVYDAEFFEESMLSQLSTEKPNVILPVSRSIEALNKIKGPLRAIVEGNPELSISLFGYPDWQKKTYTEKCLEDFHILNTYIYSHFYADNVNPRIKKFYDYYKFWYSKSPTTVDPNYSMLGFDTGLFFLTAIKDYGINFENDLSEISFESLLFGFNFDRINNWGGFINKNIYIIHYGKDFTITRSQFR